MHPHTFILASRCRVIDSTRCGASAAAMFGERRNEVLIFACVPLFRTPRDPGCPLSSNEISIKFGSPSRPWRSQCCTVPCCSKNEWAIASISSASRLDPFHSERSTPLTERRYFQPRVIWFESPPFDRASKYATNVAAPSPTKVHSPLL